MPNNIEMDDWGIRLNRPPINKCRLMCCCLAAAAAAAPTKVFFSSSSFFRHSFICAFPFFHLCRAPVTRPSIDINVARTSES
jgi:hypothetical protein